MTEDVAESNGVVSCAFRNTNSSSPPRNPNDRIQIDGENFHMNPSSTSLISIMLYPTFRSRVESMTDASSTNVRTTRPGQRPLIKAELISTIEEALAIRSHHENDQ